MKLTRDNVAPGQWITLWTEGKACYEAIIAQGLLTDPGQCEHILKFGFIYT